MKKGISINEAINILNNKAKLNEAFYNDSNDDDDDYGPTTESVKRDFDNLFRSIQGKSFRDLTNYIWSFYYVFEGIALATGQSTFYKLLNEQGRYVLHRIIFGDACDTEEDSISVHSSNDIVAYIKDNEFEELFDNKGELFDGWSEICVYEDRDNSRSWREVLSSIEDEYAGFNYESDYDDDFSDEYGTDEDEVNAQLKKAYEHNTPLDQLSDWAEDKSDSGIYGVYGLSDVQPNWEGNSNEYAIMFPIYIWDDPEQEETKTNSIDFIDFVKRLNGKITTTNYNFNILNSEIINWKALLNKGYILDKAFKAQYRNAAGVLKDLELGVIYCQHIK